MPEVIKAAACGSIIKKPRFHYKNTINNTINHIFIETIYKKYKPHIFFVREGTGIQKFKRGKWTTSDESPPKKKKTDTDSGTAHFAFIPHN
jgi:hypothetical protein